MFTKIGDWSKCITYADVGADSLCAYKEFVKFDLNMGLQKLDCRCRKTELTMIEAYFRSFGVD